MSEDTINPDLNLVKENILENMNIDSEQEVQKKEKKKDKASDNKSNQTMMRSMLTNLVSLSELADQKAGLMISVNSILVSVIITFVFSSDKFSSQHIFPVLFLLTVCVMTIVFAIIATKPNLTNLKNNSNENIDLLFFGSYAQLDKDTYIKKMKELMQKEENLQEKLILNIYAQGKVLDRKYNQLKIAYTIFLIGFPSAVLFTVIELFQR